MNISGNQSLYPPFKKIIQCTYSYFISALKSASQMVCQSCGIHHHQIQYEYDDYRLGYSIQKKQNRCKRSMAKNDYRYGRSEKFIGRRSPDENEPNTRDSCRCRLLYFETAIQRVYRQFVYR